MLRQEDCNESEASLGCVSKNLPQNLFLEQVSYLFTQVFSWNVFNKAPTTQFSKGLEKKTEAIRFTAHKIHSL